MSIGANGQCGARMQVMMLATGSSLLPSGWWVGGLAWAPVCRVWRPYHDERGEPSV